MIAREIFIAIASFAAFASAVAAYLFAFHGESPLKDILSTAFAGTLGVFVGRYIERRLING
ncbi:hypothetical protein T8S45_04350 [Blastomonas marina]|uniref:hypothetical protein n=1 Tax=Blastomonas marina TaxID=1867408 RepID=UPI002AC9B21D|nr:hypothetical protein [Blastomonas marina]WPZ04780.1 hypothetical protein T8S45_04350 [Blastomonas marina]